MTVRTHYLPKTFRQADLLDAALRASGIVSDYALAKHWGIPKQTISAYRADRLKFDAYVIHRIADTLELDARALTATQQLARESVKGPRRDYWMALQKKLFTWANTSAAVLALGNAALLLGAAATAETTHALAPAHLSASAFGKVTKAELCNNYAKFARMVLGALLAPFRSAALAPG